MKLARYALALCFALAAPLAQAQDCTTEWGQAASGAWGTASNWTAGVPTAASVACITRPGTYTVTVSATATAGRLEVGGSSGTQTLAISGNQMLTVGDGSLVGAQGALRLAGTLHKSGEVRVDGPFEWTSGNLDGEGTLLLTGDGSITTTASKSLRGGVLRNAGSLVWAAGTVYLYGGALLDNAGTLTADAATLATWGTGDWRLRNAGTLRRTAGGALNVNVHLENAGTVEALAGTIRLSRTSEHADGARLTAAAGAAVRLEGSAHAARGRLHGAPEGEVALASTLTGDGAASTSRGRGSCGRRGTSTGRSRTRGSSRSRRRRRRACGRGRS
jgi:hypothetical protein